MHTFLKNTETKNKIRTADEKSTEKTENTENFHPCNCFITGQTAAP